MTITLTREEAQQVLDAFVNWDARGRLRIIETLRTRLAQPEHHLRFSGSMHVVCKCDKCKAQPEPEPVAWHIRCIDPMGDWTLMYRCPTAETKFSNIEVQPLYTAPPQREWKGLTATERKVLWIAANNPAEFGDLLEAKLKERNA